MSKQKKLVREAFRTAVFARDKHKCVMCGAPAVDAHHITDRNLMPNGGYVKENGISVCAACHILAESHWTGVGLQPDEYSPDSLYNKINSSLEVALAASEK